MMDAVELPKQSNRDILLHLQEARNTLSAILSQLSGNGGDMVGVDGSSETAISPPRPDELKMLIRLRARRRNSSLGSFLEWPAWDMLLDLAAVAAEGKHISVSAICISSGAPQSTGLRKLAALENAGMVRRYLYGKDRRRVCLALTDKGRALVHDLIAEDLRFFATLSGGERRAVP